MQIEQVVYFGASVFWRAAVHRWTRTPGDYIELGKYEEPLRRFLLDEQRFPDDMVLSVMLSASKDEKTNRIMSLPWLAGGTPYHKFRFDIPGIMFMLYVGEQVPPECVRTCTAHTGLITICSTADETRLTSAREMVKNAEVKGRLKQSWSARHNQLENANGRSRQSGRSSCKFLIPLQSRCKRPSIFGRSTGFEPATPCAQGRFT